MLAAAHITTGIAAALAVCQPKTYRDAAIALIGGAVGGMICDIDVRAARRNRNAMAGWYTIVLLTIGIAAADKILGLKIFDQMENRFAAEHILPVLCFLCTCALMRRSAHRGFSHSLFAMCITTGFAYFVLPAWANSFAVGMASHIVLDIMNKRPVRILYPVRKGFCLDLFDSDGIANSMITALACCVFTLETVVFFAGRTPMLR